MLKNRGIAPICHSLRSDAPQPRQEFDALRITAGEAFAGDELHRLRQSRDQYAQRAEEYKTALNLARLGADADVDAPSAVEAPTATIDHDTIDHDTAVSMVTAIFAAVMTASSSALEDVVGQAVADLEENETLRGGLPHYRRYGSWEAEHWQALAGPFRRVPEEEM